MASGEEKDVAADVTQMTYKDALVDGTPASDTSDTSSHQDKESAAKDEKKNGTQNLKSNLVISGVVIAVIGAIFAIVKKVKKDA